MPCRASQSKTVRFNSMQSNSMRSNLFTHAQRNLIRSGQFRQRTSSIEKLFNQDSPGDCSKRSSGCECDAKLNKSGAMRSIYLPCDSMTQTVDSRRQSAAKSEEIRCSEAMRGPRTDPTTRAPTGAAPSPSSAAARPRAPRRRQLAIA